jgi:hypothetical protein
MEFPQLHRSDWRKTGYDSSSWEQWIPVLQLQYVFSIVLLANFKFITVNVGAYGSNSDGAVFANSSPGKALRDGSLCIPENKPLPGANDPLPHVIVGDEAFLLRTYLLRSNARAQLRGCEQKSVFNYRLGRARRVSETCFGLITQKFRVFQRRLQQTP